MKRIGKIAVFLLIALLLAAGLFAVFGKTGAGRQENYENLLANSGFEQGSEDWSRDAYVVTAGYTDFEVRPGEGRNGSQALYIRNHYLNDARFWQEVDVEKDTLYHLHGYVRADAEMGWGANLSVDGVYVYSDQVFLSGDAWQEVSLYGRTGKDQTTLKVFVRLGGYSGESVGEAWFDDVTLTRVDHIPDGYTEKVLYKAQSSSAASDADESGKSANLPLVCAALVYTVMCYFAMQYMRREQPLSFASRKSNTVLGVLLFLALALRIALALLVHGYDVDTNDFMVWAHQMTVKKPWGFYVDGGFCDYPPGALLVLWVLGTVGNWFGGMNVLLVKMPSILCDLLIGLFLFRMAKKHTGKDSVALSVALLALFNPLMLTAGAAWGQVDSVMVLPLLLVIYFALTGQWRFALPVYGAAVLFKPQALMFGPLGLIALVMAFVQAYRTRDKEKISALWMQFGQGMAFMVMLMALVVVPFSIRQGGIGWVFRLYQRTMSYYSQATVNSCNLYFLFGLNWVDVQNKASFLAALCGTLVLFAPAAVFVFVKKQPLWMKTAVCAPAVLVTAGFAVLSALGVMTWAHMGTVLMALSIAIVLLLYVRTGETKHLPLLGAVLLTVLFTLGTMMHERYLVPAVAFLLMAYVLEKDKRILWLTALVSVMCLFNVGAVLDRNMRIGGAGGHLSAPYFNINSDMSVLEYLSSGMSLVASAAALYLSFDLCRQAARPLEMKPCKESTSGTDFADVRSGCYEKGCLTPVRKMDGKDCLIMGITTLLFAALTFTNLGSAKAPQDGYVFTDMEEQVVLDLGKETEFHLLAYGGIHYADTRYTVEVSRDGVVWEVPHNAMLSDSGDCFKWKYVTEYYGEGLQTQQFNTNPADFYGRYVRIRPQTVGLSLFEVIARDWDGNQLPVTVLEGNEGTEKLVNEQDTLEGEPSWKNSTYFDEIYHARTAYEHLHGLVTYEWTHPPLGKVLMSWAISVFGMTPFGWRFAGALMGVCMLPGMYLLGKALFKKRIFAFAAMALMTLDFMHFTQTRIATIDSFVVCFIIWSMYFMVRYLALDFWRIKYWKTFVPLALSGLFMGLAVASKWTGCYAGVGLALLFFWSVWRRGVYVYRLKKQPDSALTAEEKAVAKNGYRMILCNVLSCFVFFVAVPLAVYGLSYIPHFAHSGGVTVKKIIAECERMLWYHGQPGLGMDHFFYSPWYEWPFAVTPMWYSSSPYEPQGMEMTIMAFGNPAVWWIGAAMLVALAIAWCVRHVRRDSSLALHAVNWDPRIAVILLSFFAQYLPWMLVPRGTYIYHYFTAVPFVILANVYVFAWLEEKKKGLGKWLVFGQVLIALALFIAFFPYISGVMVSQKWLEAMKWFPGWIYY